MCCPVIPHLNHDYVGVCAFRVFLEKILKERINNSVMFPAMLKTEL